MSEHTKRSADRDINSMTKIAATAVDIYRERYQEEYERDRKGEYVAIDVMEGGAYVDESPGGALEKARKEAPHGVFHLIRIGFESAFTATRLGVAQEDWLWGGPQ